MCVRMRVSVCVYVCGWLWGGGFRKALRIRANTHHAPWEPSSLEFVYEFVLTNTLGTTSEQIQK